MGLLTRPKPGGPASSAARPVQDPTQEEGTIPAFAGARVQGCAALEGGPLREHRHRGLWGLSPPPTRPHPPSADPMAGARPGLVQDTERVWATPRWEPGAPTPSPELRGCREPRPPSSRSPRGQKGWPHSHSVLGLPAHLGLRHHAHSHGTQTLPLPPRGAGPLGMQPP